MSILWLIYFCAGIPAVAYVIWRIYRAMTTVRYHSASTVPPGEWVGLSTSDRSHEHGGHCKGNHRWGATIVPSLWKCVDCGTVVDVWWTGFGNARGPIQCACKGCAENIRTNETLAESA